MSIKYRRNDGFTIWELFIVIAIIGILAAMAIPNHRGHHRGNARKKACFSNMRVLQGAIEMYNMDVVTMMRELDDNNQKILIEGKYIKSKDPLVCPETSGKGKYYSIGDITENGFIYCSYHGNLEEIKITPDMTYQEYVKEKERIEKEKEEKLIKAKREELFAQVGIGGGILGLISFIFVLMPQSKKKKV